MHSIYLSPHLDDAVFSCGGLIWQQQQNGDEVELWTIFAGDPPGELTPFARELHARWQAGEDAVALRRAEDDAACKILGVKNWHAAYPDCIYRRNPATHEPVIVINEDLFKPVQEGEEVLVRSVSDQLQQQVSENALVFCPLAIGGHVDHRLTRLAAEKSGLTLAYYADFPYSKGMGLDAGALLPAGGKKVTIELEPDDIDTWIRAMAEYRSQLSSFWSSEVEMAEDVASYAQSEAGRTYWLNCV